MDILLASHNKKKMTELKAILDRDLEGVCVHSLDEVDLNDDIVEDGETFEDNALIKARAARGAAVKAGHPDWICLGDDSGLAVDALDGAPGVYSARYAGGHGDDAANNACLLRNMAGVPDDRRTARFVCCIACVKPDGAETTVRGTCAGVILREARGEGGFGYDPLFYILALGKTFSELAPAEKHAISHRGKALAAMAERLKESEKETKMNTAIKQYPAPAPLSSGQRAYLRHLAADLPTIMQIGKGGLTENLAVTVSDALEARELIKLSVLETSEWTAREAAEALAEALNATVVSVIGRKLILFRRPLNKKNQRIELPR